MERQETDAALTPHEATRKIKEAANCGGKLILPPHAMDELHADGFDINDLLSAIREGFVTRTEPKSDGKTRYTLEGNPVDQTSGKKLSFVFELYAGNRAVVITCFKTNATKRRLPGSRRS